MNAAAWAARTRRPTTAGGAKPPSDLRLFAATCPMPLPLFRLSPPGQREWLAQALARPAPESAKNLSDGFRLPGCGGAATAAAVLVPLVNRPDGLQVLLTQRSADLPDHPGQISFPGGRVEPADASHAAAALREANEEVGLPERNVTVLGHLAEYETVTGFRVTPVVGWVEPPFELTRDPIEVADIFEVPLSFVLDPANQQRHFRMLGTIRRDFWAIPYRERYIWGATAAMLLILDRTLRDYPR
jgi:8-oxo-dGTP pyrophosphatase MutT (NUDIX family)